MTGRDIQVGDLVVLRGPSPGPMRCVAHTDARARTHFYDGGSSWAATLRLATRTEIATCRKTIA